MYRHQCLIATPSSLRLSHPACMTSWPVCFNLSTHPITLPLKCARTLPLKFLPRKCAPRKCAPLQYPPSVIPPSEMRPSGAAWRALIPVIQQVLQEPHLGFLISDGLLNCLPAAQTCARMCERIGISANALMSDACAAAQREGSWVH